MYICRLSRNIQIISSKERPKKLILVNNRNEKFFFLCKQEKKGDIRKDLRMMEYITIVNRILAADSQGEGKHLQLCTFVAILFLHLSIQVCHMSLRKQRADRVGSQLGAHSTQNRPASRAQRLVLQQFAGSPIEERLPARAGLIREEAARVRALAVHQYNSQRFEASAARMVASRLPRSAAMAPSARSVHADDGCVEHDGIYILLECREGS